MWSTRLFTKIDELIIVNRKFVIHTKLYAIHTYYWLNISDWVIGESRGGRARRNVTASGVHAPLREILDPSLWVLHTFLFLNIWFIYKIFMIYFMYLVKGSNGIWVNNESWRHNL